LFLYVKSALDIAISVKLRVERMSLGIPKNWPIHRFNALYGVEATKSTRLEIIIKDVPNVAQAKCLLCNDKIPPANPNANPARPNIPISKSACRG